jgi:predicted metal-dependent hydrolase
LKPYLEDLDLIEEEMNEQEDLETTTDELDETEPVVIEVAVTVEPYELINKSYRQDKINAVVRKLEAEFDNIADEYGVTDPLAEFKEMDAAIEEAWRSANNVRSREFEALRRAERERQETEAALKRQAIEDADAANRNTISDALRGSKWNHKQRADITDAIIKSKDREGDLNSFTYYYGDVTGEDYETCDQLAKDLSAVLTAVDKLLIIASKQP